MGGYGYRALIWVFWSFSYGCVAFIRYSLDSTACDFNFCAFFSGDLRAQEPWKALRESESRVWRK